MIYKAAFLNIFLKQFKKLPEGDKTRINRRVKELLENPYLGLRLKGELDGFWKDRIGTYRLIYKINESAKEIIFYDVDLRKRVYD